MLSAPSHQHCCSHIPRRSKARLFSKDLPKHHIITIICRISESTFSKARGPGLNLPCYRKSAFPAGITRLCHPTDTGQFSRAQVCPNSQTTPYSDLLPGTELFTPTRVVLSSFFVLSLTYIFRFICQVHISNPFPFPIPHPIDNFRRT